MAKEESRIGQKNSAIAIDTGEKEFYTGFDNVVMIFDKPNKEESK